MLGPRGDGLVLRQGLQRRASDAGRRGKRALDGGGAPDLGGGAIALNGKGDGIG